MSGDGKIDLYFYTHLESKEHCDRVMQLLDSRLLLSDPHGFNDPFDSKLRFRHAITDAEAQAELKKQGGLWSRITPNPSFAKNLIENQRERISSQYRIFCFSEHWNSLLMWAHYARSHQGLCLKLSFNPDKLLAGDRLEKIRYTTHYPEIYGEDIVRKDEGALKTLLLTKSVDWLYEKEWRYITHYNSCKHDNILEAEYVDLADLFEVKAVYLGINFDDLRMLRKIQCVLSQRMDVDLRTKVCDGTIQSAENHSRVIHEYCERQKEVFGLIERNSQEELKTFFDGAWNDKMSSIKECVFREQVMLKISNKKIPVFKCEKTKGMFGLSLNAVQFNPLGSLKHHTFGLGPEVVDDEHLAKKYGLESKCRGVSA